MWPNRQILDLFKIRLPIIQAPMAGACGREMVIATSQAGGLGSLPCAMLSPEVMRAEVGIIRQQTANPINLNFFCHQPAAPDAERAATWRAELDRYYVEFGLDAETKVPALNRAPVDEDAVEIIEDFKPEVVSFHFGLPASDLLDRIKATGAKVISSATTVAEAVWLADNGCDAVIAQGYEAGGHRGIFLSDNVASQPGTLALVPQVVDAVNIPVIAAGGIADGRGVVAVMALGAAAAQVGTAYLFTPEAKISDLHRAALAEARDDQTALTNLFSGRPARGLINRVMREVGPMSAKTPAFPTAGGALAPLRAKAEAEGSGDFTSLWSGQAAALSREMSSTELTRMLADDALALLKSLASN